MKPLNLSLPPARIGKYPVVREIGRGATSRVYLGRDSFAERDVAIKVFSPLARQDGLAARRFKKLFLSEASLVGRLTHPHIAAIFDAATDDESSYIVMEYVPGGTLEPHTKVDRLLPLGKLVEIVFKCARALDFALHNGVIHRDIKPANILICHDTEIKISDFGTAWQEGIEQTTQLTGVGSPAYMSPEQIRDQPLTQQTDIYSLGVVMYQLLTGQLPFSGSNKASLTYQVINIEPAPPSVLRPDIPPALDAIVLKAMKKSLAERFPSWPEFAMALAQTFGMVRVREDGFSDTEKFNTVKAFALFHEFDDVQIWEMLRIASWKRVPADTVVMRENEPQGSFCFMVAGQAKVTRSDKLLHLLEPGDCFGEMLYFAGNPAPRTTTIATTADSIIAEIQAESLRKATDACQVQFNKAFLRLLVARLDQAHQRLAAS